MSLATPGLAGSDDAVMSPGHSMASTARWSFAIAAQLAAAAWVCNPAAAANVPLRLEIAPQARDVGSNAVELEFVSQSAQVESIRAIWKPPAKSVSVSLARAGRWRVRCLGRRVFCPDLELDAAEGSAAARLAVFPASDVTGMVSTSGRRPAPKEIVLQARLVAEPHAATEIVQRVQVEEHRFRALLPQATVDLRLAANESAPVYFWSQVLGPTTDLGRVEFVPGASLSGRILRERAGRERIVLRLKPAYSADDALARRAQAFSWSARTSTRGFFQFRGIGPGFYDLEAVVPSGPVPIAEGIEVVEDAEVRLQELHLKPPVRVQFQLDPKQPPQGWGGSAWRIRLAQPGRPPAATGSSDTEGTVVLEDYTIRGDVRDEAGEPIAGATVSAGPVQGQTDGAGRFELHGFSPGRHAVSALSPAGQAPAREVALDSSRPTAAVSCVIQRARLAKGRLVMANDQPIAGAGYSLRWIGFRESDGTTGIEGEFNAEVPAGARRGHVLLRSSSHPLWASCVDAPEEGQELLIRTPAPLGSASIVTSPVNDGPPIFWLVRQGGGVIGLSHFGSLGRLQRDLPATAGSPPTAWTLTNVAAGSYALVDGRMSWEQITALSCGGVLEQVSWSPAASGQTTQLMPQAIDRPERGSVPSALRD